jgi:hypothetical protein
MTGMCEMYSKTPSEFIFELYYESLKNYTYEAVNSAAMMLLKTHKYNTLPKPAEFIEWIDGNQEDRAVIAWTKARRAIREADWCNSVVFDDPVISHVIQDLGGWLQFCDTKKEDIEFMEKRFIQFYRTLSKRGITNPVRVMGYLEQENIKTGYAEHIPTPVYIGDDKQKKIGETDGQKRIS